MKIRAHEAEVLVVGAEEEQTAEIIRIMLQGCTAEVPSRLPAEVPRRLCAGALALPATTTPRRCPWCWLPYRALAGKLCGRIAATAPALTTAELPSISSLRNLAGGTMLTRLSPVCIITACPGTGSRCQENARKDT